ncbi:MAG: ATP-binding protein [Chloroflexi bacterium]|nr:ATP-binding protein [Chloroflexota bacterium]
MIPLRCAKCHAHFSDSEVREIKEINKLWEKYRPQFDLMGMGLLCSICDTMRDDAVIDAETNGHRQRQMQKRDLIRMGDWPLEASDCTWGSYKPALVSKCDVARWDAARNWQYAWGSIWVHGPNGVGKTFVARCMGNVALEEGRKAIEVKASYLSRTANDFRKSDMHKKLCEYPFLLLDDADKAEWKEAGARLLFEILDCRYEKRLCTVVTSNHTQAAFIGQLQAACPGNDSIATGIEDRLKPLRLELGFEGKSVR